MPIVRNKPQLRCIPHQTVRSNHDSASGYSSSCQASVSEDNTSMCRSSSPPALTPCAERYPAGTIVKKYFHGHGWCSGVVLSFSAGHYKVHYEQSSPGANPPKECRYAPSEMTRLLKTAAVETGTRLEIYWPQEQRYHAATVKTERPRKRENYLICYDDTACTSITTDREWIDLHRHKFRILDGPSWKIDFDRLPHRGIDHPKEVVVPMPAPSKNSLLLNESKPIAPRVATRNKAKKCADTANHAPTERNDQSVDQPDSAPCPTVACAITDQSTTHTECVVSLDAVSALAPPSDNLSNEMSQNPSNAVSCDVSLGEKAVAPLMERIEKEIVSDSVDCRIEMSEESVDIPRTEPPTQSTECSKPVLDDSTFQDLQMSKEVINEEIDCAMEQSDLKLDVCRSEPPIRATEITKPVLDDLPDQNEVSPTHAVVSMALVTTEANDQLVEPDDSTLEKSVSALIADGASSELDSPCSSSDTRSIHDFGGHDLPPMLSQRTTDEHIKVESKSIRMVSNDLSHVVPSDNDVDSQKDSVQCKELPPAAVVNAALQIKDDESHTSEAKHTDHAGNDDGDDDDGIIVDPESDPSTRLVVCSLIEIGSRVAIYWPGDERFYSGTVTDRRFRGKPFYVEYDDGEEEWIDLRKMKFRLLQSGTGLQKDDQKNVSNVKPTRKSRDSALGVSKPDNKATKDDHNSELSSPNAPSRNGRKKALDALVEKKRKSRSSSEGNETAQLEPPDSPELDDFSKISVGSRVAVWWDGDKTYYSGVVQRERAHRKSFYLVYDDGEEEEWIDLREQKFKLLPPVEKRKRGRPRKECSVTATALTPSKRAHTDKENALQPEETPKNQICDSTKETSAPPNETPKNQSCDSKKRGRPKKEDNVHPDDIHEIRVGSRVSVWWSGASAFYEGTVTRKRADDMPFFIEYDGDEPGHWIDFSKRTFRLLDKLSTAAASDVPKRQKLSRKENGESEKRKHESSESEKQKRESSEKANTARCRMGPNSTPSVAAKGSDNKDKHKGASRLKDSPNDEESDGEFSLGITVGSRISVFWEGDSKYYEGVITRERKNSKKRHYLEYDDGEAAHWIDLKEHWVRVLSGEKSTDTSKKSHSTAKADEENDSDVETTPRKSRQGKKSETNDVVADIKVGTRVKIWWSGDQLYYPGLVRKIETKRCFVEYDDGEKAWVGQHLVHVMTKEDEEALLSDAESSESDDHMAYKDFVYGDVRRVRVGSRLAIWWPSEKKYFNGTVKKITDSRTPYFVKYDDGDEESTDLRRRYFRFLD